ncbi:hypothetical protein AX769_21510 (plasmid) [Frondihabitans sp. PAMC 28766]|uniref:GAF domain-containing sensor histidine kinase n=1 Tax=Frondihabitans sp. PAMC 28766 TaxID=1795630 RepID=UPI00078BAEF1|nr:GAF domain-containing protein [Frondihabitans sp. PAMC 28766]AMM22703.1 hypothetical protein AX769_21510 [Frondihabitans sp. PAMC 28766]
MNAPNSLLFPDGAKSELDQALASLITSAERVAGTQGRLRNLMRANRAIVEQLDLSTMLKATIEAAIDLVGARYGALGVMAPEGGLDEFIQVGISDEVVARIGHLPEGHGLLGAVLDEAHPIRLQNLQDDPRSSGFPASHPPMHGFLGVPIRVREQLFGSLYFAEKIEGEFTQEDEELLTSLATTAGIAIENARLFDETQKRQRWATLSADVATALLSSDTEAPLRLLSDSVAEIAEADLVCIVVPIASGMVIIDTARGALAEDVEGLVVPAEDTRSEAVMTAAEPLLVTSLTVPRTHDVPLLLGPSMLIPLLSGAGPVGVLSVSRALGRARFNDSDMDMITGFARQATLAIDVANVRLDRHRLERLEDRSRIARDLHDHVIQRLFAAGLALQAKAHKAPNEAARSDIEQEIDTLDTAIAEIRTAIFALTPPRRGLRSSVRHRIIDLLTEIGAMFATTPRLTFLGTVDLLVIDEMADDVVAVVREGLSNVARHAHASQISVKVAVAEGQIEVEIMDDGDGFHPGDRRSGLLNLRSRAEQWQGTSDTVARPDGGTRMTWTALLTDIPTHEAPS